MVGLIVHDWLELHGGSELVVQQMHRAFPDADVFTLWNNNPALLAPLVPRESVLASRHLRGRKAMLLPVMPLVWRNTYAARAHYDWLLVSSHSFAHQIRARPGVRKFVYVHSPARYLWVPELDQRGDSPLRRAVARPLKAVDRALAAGPSSIAANSEYIRERIARAWHRDAQVIYPPVRVARLQSVASWADALDSQDSELLESLPDSFLLGASRFVSYKNLDRVIEAGEAVDLPVVLAGRGPDRDLLVAKAADARIPVRIVDSPSDPLLFALYQRCHAFLFPAIEDFGLMPVEAAAVGARVIVERTGGAKESVREGVTGAVVDFRSPREVRKAIDAASDLAPGAAREHARIFGEQRFHSALTHWLVSAS